MFRFRRYRVYVIGTAVILFLLFRLSHNSEWDAQPAIYRGYKPPQPPPSQSNPKADASSNSSPPPPLDNTGAGVGGVSPHKDSGKVVPDKPPAKEAAPVKASSIRLPELRTSLEVDGSYALPTTRPTTTSTSTHKTALLDGNAVVNTIAEGAAPLAASWPTATSTPLANTDANTNVDADANATSEHVNALPDIITPPAAIHWKKMPEHFPVPEGSLIPLPIGAPKPIPRIQHLFEPESDAARDAREARRASVLSEMKRAWSGYRTYAWNHDELAPVSKAFRDPFCGWAASIVDALDTLWIMGMRDEFDEAYEAVKAIDFTITKRHEIPVFETIIRYLGGLIAAYDVSGGKQSNYPALLDKAVELAEILMGVFDTPNRMPVLYYAWKPDSVSQPKRAGSRSGIAELGSMTMEFTRLAQLTGHDKYYDAIARIVDALEEWQNRGTTAIPGIFPQNVDASGCNRTVAAIQQLHAASTAAQEQAAAANDTNDEPVGYVLPQSVSTPTVAADNIAVANTAPLNPELPLEPKKDQPGEPSVGEFHSISKRGLEDVAALPLSASLVLASTKTPAVAAASAATAEAAPLLDEPLAAPATPPSTIAKTGGSGPIAGTNPGGLYRDHTPAVPLQVNGRAADWDCVPQNLTSGGYGMDSFSMGGSQDSTYEYFQKQYLLLGGLVPKYRDMHEKTVEAVIKYLLYRPMIKDEQRDILFSARAASRDGTDKSLIYEYEITHLTCFLGGMFAMGGRIFDRPEDIEIGKKLTDGCVWAYESMPTGIMPEFSTIVACYSTAGCEFNQTMWHERLDPSKDWRESQMKDYEERVKEWKAQKAEVLEIQELRRQANEKANLPQESASGDSGSAAVASSPVPPAAAPISKRDVDAGVKKKEVLLTADTANVAAAGSDEKVKALENDLDLNNVASTGHTEGSSSGASSSNSVAASSSTSESADQLPLVDPVIPPEPVRPQTHEEFVLNKIEKEGLQPGFQSINDRRYILRPEAIESVWYMYRITGNPEWQEKGWRMWEAIVKETQTEIGHSAIQDVTGSPDTPQDNHADNMESFWFAETLKYFYLLYSPPDVLSLDDWVLNTEAHPFKRPT